MIINVIQIITMLLFAYSYCRSLKMVSNLVDYNDEKIFEFSEKIEKLYLNGLKSLRRIEALENQLKQEIQDYKKMIVDHKEIIKNLKENK